MIVLSLFGGMECGRITLDRMGVTPTQYYSAEIDKFAVAEVTANYPDVIHLGDVTRWREWDIPWGDIDLVIGGSPCQGFSRLGSLKGLKDERSRLFFEYVDILRHCQGMSRITRGEEPWFMLENTEVDEFSESVISKELGVNKVAINSNLISHAGRPRYYWSNWLMPQPLPIQTNNSDIVGDDWVSMVVASSKNRVLKRTDKFGCLVAHYHKGVDAAGRPIAAKPHCEGELIYNLKKNIDYRMLTVIECCRLQGVPDDYFKVSSNTQAYKMLGNGWQCDTIEHIFNHCPLFTGGPRA